MPAETTRNILDLTPCIGRGVDIVYATGITIGAGEVHARVDSYTWNTERVTVRQPHKGVRTRAVRGTLTGVYSDRITLDPSTIEHLHPTEPSGKKRSFAQLPYKDDGSVPLSHNIRSIDTPQLRWENPAFRDYLRLHSERTGPF